MYMYYTGDSRSCFTRIFLHRVLENPSLFNLANNEPSVKVSVLGLDHHRLTQGQALNQQGLRVSDIAGISIIKLNLVPGQLT